jgi:arginase
MCWVRVMGGLMIIHRPRGIRQELMSCLGLVPRFVEARSLTVCSFDPDAGDGGRIAGIAIKAIEAFVVGLLERGVLVRG